MPDRTCEACGNSFAAQRSTHRFCSARCRERAHAGRVVPIKQRSKSEASTSKLGKLERATLRKLEAAERAETVEGVHALVIAAQIDGAPPAAVAGLSKAFLTAMEVALDGVGVAADPLDELRARRDAKRTG